MCPSMFSRRSCLPTVKGEAERLTMACAPALSQDFDRVLMVAPALPEIAIVPDVFADADAQAAAVQLEDPRLAAGLEVAVFVEDIVGGQQRFVEGRADDAVAQQDRAIEERPPDVGGIGRGDADQHRRRVLQFRGEARELWQLRCTKPLLISRSRGR